MELERFGRDFAFVKLLVKLGKVVPETWACMLGRGFVVELSINLEIDGWRKGCPGLNQEQLPSLSKVNEWQENSASTTVS